MDVSEIRRNDAPLQAREQKQRLRAEIRERRLERLRRADGGVSNAERFADHLIALATEHRARRVSCFASTTTEPDTSGFLVWAREHGVEVLLPRSLPGTELAWVVQEGSPLTPGRYGIPEPGGDPLPSDALDSCDLIIVPAAAVDRSGTRLGWGRGYFDRALGAVQGRSTAAPVFAVVYENEVLDELPREPHDAPVAGAVTEAGIHRFG